MPQPTTEIIIFPTTEAARADPHLGKPAFDIVLKAPGAHKPVYYGLQIENAETGYNFLHWDSYEHHAALMKDPSYPELRKALEPVMAGKAEMYHVVFSSETIALEQPVTEVLVLTLKDPKDRDSLEGILEKISLATAAKHGGKKMLVYGKTREDENKYIAVGGWQTVQDHWDTVTGPEVDKVLQELHSLANKEHLCHTSLFQHHS